MLTERADLPGELALARSRPFEAFSKAGPSRRWRLTVQLPTALFAAGAVLVSLWMLDFRLRRWQAAPSPNWRDDGLLWRTLAMVALLYLVVGSFWFQYWDLVWVLAPAVLLPDALLTRWLPPWLGFGALSDNLISAFASIGAGAAIEVAPAALIVAVIWTPMLSPAGGISVVCTCEDVCPISNEHGGIQLILATLHSPAAPTRHRGRSA